MPEDNVGTIEERARRMGHVPLDQFRGNPDNWVDAETFVRRAEESLPFLKGTLKTMEQKMAEQDRVLRQQTELVTSLKADMTDFVAFSRGAEQRAYEKAVSELKAEQERAKTEGDMPAFVAATEKLDAVIAEHPAVTGKDNKPSAITDAKPKTADEEWKAWMAAEPTVFDEWVQEHKWFNEDPEMFAYAQQMDQFLQVKDGFKKPRSQRLKDIAELVKKKFPVYFGTAARASGSPVEGDSGGAPNGGNGRRTYHDLPEDAKKQCDKWTGKDGKGKDGTIPGLTRDDFLKSYKW